MWHIVPWIRWWLDCHFLYFNCEISMCYTAIRSFIRSTPEYMYMQCAGGSSTSIIDSVADVDQVIKIQLTFHFSRIFLSQLRREDILMTSWLRRTLFDFIYRSSLQSLTIWYSRKWKTCWTSAWETFKLTFCRLFKNGCLGYRFRHNNNKTYKNRPVYLGRIFSQQLFVNCWKKTQFWRAL